MLFLFAQFVINQELGGVRQIQDGDTMHRDVPQSPFKKDLHVLRCIALHFIILYIILCKKARACQFCNVKDRNDGPDLSVGIHSFLGRCFVGIQSSVVFLEPEVTIFGHEPETPPIFEA